MKYLIEQIKDSVRKNDYYLDTRYVINDGKEHDFAIIAPGGGYGFVSTHNEGVPFAEELNKRGISAFILIYHVKNKAKFPTPHDDLARAIDEILTNKEKYHISDNYILIGASAGAHLVSTFVYLDRYNHLIKPKALILAYPVISMDKEITHLDSRKRLIGDNPSEELIKLMSAELNVTSDYPPTFIFYGEDDHFVNTKNSTLLAEALKENNVKYKIKSYKGVKHGVGLGKHTPAKDWFKDAIDFVKTIF